MPRTVDRSPALPRMPKKAGGKKKKGSKKGSKKAEKSGPPAPPNYHGKTPGGIPIIVTARGGGFYNVAELRYAPVPSLKTRLAEVTGLAASQMHLFTESPAGRPVAELRGYAPTWSWPATRLLVELMDEFSLDVYVSLCSFCSETKYLPHLTPGMA